MAIVSTLQFRRRASRRMIRDLPGALEELGLDDPVMLLTGRVREVIERDQQFERGKAPYERRTWFGIPSSPPSSRLRSSAGLESFHLAINKTSARTAAAFDRYATRDTALAADVGERGVGQLGSDNAVLAPERPATTFDGYAMGHGADADQPPLSLSTLDPRSDVRRAQWEQVEAHERDQRRNPGGGPPRINLRFEQAPELLIEAVLRNECPSGLRDTILAERDRVAAERELPRRLQRDGVPWISSDAPRVMAWLETLPGWAAPAPQQPAAKLSMGRGTPTVIAGELELPRGLGEAAHRNIMLGLNSFIQQQAQESNEGSDAEGQLGEGTSVPFIAVRHQPDALNNPLNIHLHFQHGTRLAAADSSGQLDFATHKVETIAAKGWIKRLRCEAARLMNAELDAIGTDYRLSPDTYAAMGIKAATQIKLHGERVILERAGVPTSAGLANDAEGWRRQFEQVQRDHDAASLELDRRHTLMADRIKAVDDTRAKRLEAERLAVQAEEKRALDLRLEEAEIAVLVEMARSRPEQTAQYASGYADKVMRPDGQLSYAAMRWRQLGADADACLAELDVELAMERDAIAEREREASLAEERAQGRWQGIDTALSVQDASPDRSAAIPTGTATMAAARPPSPAAAVTLIATTPVHLTETSNGFIIRREDDPEGRVRGVDLATQRDRLRGVHASQEKELTQLRAWVRRHGQAGLQDEALGTASPWIQRSARRWRDTRVFKRMVMADRAFARGYAALLAEAVDAEPLEALRDALPMMPGRADPALLARNGVVLAPERKRVTGLREVVKDATPVSVQQRRVAAPAAPVGSERGSRPVAPHAPAAKLAITDGFGGTRDEPAPTFIWAPVGAKVIAFDRTTNAPTQPLLRLLAFAGRNPDKLAFGTDDRLMTLSGTPKMIEPLMRMWRNDDAVQTLVVETVAASRAAGRPVWPSHLASRIRDLDPSPAPDRALSRDWSSGIKH
jgi:hypothetical protein